MKKILLLSLFTVSILYCAIGEKSSNLEQLYLMTYNVENLFDEFEDEVQDVSYLPLKYKRDNGIFRKCKKIRSRYYRKNCYKFDWNTNKVEAKLENLADIIATANEGKGPDVLYLQEVENRAILERLKKKLIKKGFQYNIAHIEGPDKRGIDTALFTKFKIESTKLLVNPNIGMITRGFLEVNISLPMNRKLIAYSVHFPSQGKRTPKRESSLNFLIKLMKKKLKLHPNAILVTAGDFNIIKPEEKNGIYGNISPFEYSHNVGCKTCKGTYYYARKKSWSFFDVFIFPKIYTNEHSKVQLIQGSIKPLNGTLWQNEEDEDGDLIPRRFQSSMNGVSDHWPMVMKLQLK